MPQSERGYIGSTVNTKMIDIDCDSLFYFLKKIDMRDEQQGVPLTPSQAGAYGKFEF